MERSRLKFIWLINVIFESEMAKKLTVETGQSPIQEKKIPSQSKINELQFL